MMEMGKITVADMQFIKAGKKLYTFFGKSTDTKPTNEVATGSQFVEIDTEKVAFFDEDSGEWIGGTSGGDS